MTTRIPLMLAMLGTRAVGEVVPARGTPASPPVHTVFGLGPELHLFPNLGPVGTKVLAIGIGYRPGAHVNIVYGSPNASFMPQPLVTVVVASKGTFRTSFTVSCAFVVLHTREAMHPPKRCPLSSSDPFRAVVVGAFVDHRFAHKRTAVEGFIVTG